MTIIEDLAKQETSEIEILNPEWCQIANATMFIQPFSTRYRINTGIAECAPNQPYMCIGGTGSAKDLVFKEYGLPLLGEISKQLNDKFELPQNFSKEKFTTRLFEHPYGLLYVPESSGLLLKEKSGSYQGGVFEFLCNILDGYLEPSDTFARGEIGRAPVWVTFLTTGSFQFFHEIPKDKWFTQGIARRVAYKYLPRQIFSERTKESYDPQFVNGRIERIFKYACRISNFAKALTKILTENAIDYYSGVLFDGEEMAKFENECNLEVKSMEEQGQFLLSPIVQDAKLTAFRMAGIHALARIEAEFFKGENIESYFADTKMTIGESLRVISTMPLKKDDELWGINKAKLSIQDAKTILNKWTEHAPSRKAETEQEDLDRLVTIVRDAVEITFTKWLKLSRMNGDKFLRLRSTLIASERIIHDDKKGVYRIGEE